jgi:hypothetical protein
VDFIGMLNRRIAERDRPISDGLKCDRWTDSSGRTRKGTPHWTNASPKSLELLAVLACNSDGKRERADARVFQRKSDLLPQPVRVRGNRKGSRPSSRGLHGSFK